jgi:hypothetical protein
MRNDSSLRIIVTGLIGQHPSLGGVTWDYLQYALGLARLGHDVYYFEDSGQWPYTNNGGPSGNDWVARECGTNVEHLAKTMARFGLQGKWAYHFPTARQWYGLSGENRRRVIESADLLINVSGTLEHPENYRGVKRLIYIDSDPAFTQVKLALTQEHADFCDRVNAHDMHFSFGEHFTSVIPDTGHHWRPTRQPIVLSEWQSSMAPRNVYTTVMSWTSYKPISYAGRSFGQKDIEFRRFLELARSVHPISLEVAMHKLEHIDWQTDDNDSLTRICGKACTDSLTPYDLLTLLGWRVVDPSLVCANLDDYRAYIESSKAEWSVAKNGYVTGRAGWFSCRSACYLAAGRPVIVQDTGFGAVLPVGEGILSFSTIDEAVAAIVECEANYERHANAARAIAETYFDSDKVLSRLIEDAMAGRPGSSATQPHV